MCGIGGFTGVTDLAKRRTLVAILGLGTDTRGGDAIGYTTVCDDGTVNYGRTLGTWVKARDRFVESAAAGPTCMLHARFATLPNKADVTCAHPFAIHRNDKTILWGAHNGVATNAYSSAKRHGRDFTVDSREVFELLADGRTQEIGNLEGWGVISWIRNDDRDKIRLAVLTKDGALYVARTECGAIVYGSTEGIVHEALDVAEMKQASSYAITQGVVYYAHGGTFCYTEEPKLTFREYSYRWLERGKQYDWAKGLKGFKGAKSWAGSEYGRYWNEDDGDYTGADEPHGFCEVYPGANDAIAAEDLEDDEDDSSGELLCEVDASDDHEAHDEDVDDYEIRSDGVLVPITRRARLRPKVRIFTGEDDESKDWWRELENADDFDRASFLRQLAESEKGEGALR